MVGEPPLPTDESAAERAAVLGHGLAALHVAVLQVVADPSHTAKLLLTALPITNRRSYEEEDDRLSTPLNNQEHFRTPHHPLGRMVNFVPTTRTP